MIQQHNIMTQNYKLMIYIHHKTIIMIKLILIYNRSVNKKWNHLTLMVMRKMVLYRIKVIVHLKALSIINKKIQC